MKRTIILLLIIPHFLIAQKQFAPLNATWRYEVFSVDCYNNFLRYNVEKEIEIDGKDCSVIYAYTSYRLSPFEKTQDSLIVWEDDNKVYFYQNDSFWLFYDFNLEEGDRIDYYLPYNRGVFSPKLPNSNDSIPFVSTIDVTDVEEIEVNGIMLKKFTTSYPYPGYGIANSMGVIIENIGSMRARLLGQDEEYIAIGCGPNFLCYEDDNSSYPIDEVCEYPTSTNNLYTAEEIRFYPNPAKEHLTIENNTSENIKRIEIFNTNGSKIKSYDGSLSTISLIDLKKGFYFVNMSFDSGNSHIAKIVKL